MLSFTPLILFVAFLLMEPMPEDATLPRAPIPGFARHKNANCDYATQAAMTNVSDPAQCAKACEQEMGCVGFVHSRRKRRCWRKTACTPLRPSSRVSTYLRRGVALPALPSRENPHEWALNTTLVLVWRGRDLSFLARLPARRVELVVYMLPVPVQPAASNRSASLSKYPHRWYGTSLTGTAAYRAEHEVRRWGQPLAFLRQLPHARSLADALPLGIVTFVLEFYHSLPKEVIFTDDRGCPGESCPWLLSLLPTPPPAAMNDAKRAFLAAYIAGGGERGNKDDFGPSEPADDRGLLLRCRCRLGSAAAALLARRRRLLARRRVADVVLARARRAGGRRAAPRGRQLCRRGLAAAAAAVRDVARAAVAAAGERQVRQGPGHAGDAVAGALRRRERARERCSRARCGSRSGAGLGRRVRRGDAARRRASRRRRSATPASSCGCASARASSTTAWTTSSTWASTVETVEHAGGGHDGVTRGGVGVVREA